MTGAEHSGRVLPIVKLVREKVAGRDVRAFAEERGIPYSTLRHYHSLDLPPLKQLPRPATRRQLAEALHLGLDEVERAAVDSLAGRYDPASPEPTISTEVSDLEEAIDRDPRLLPETRAHLRNQLELLLRIQGASPELLARQEERRQRALTEQEALTSIHEELEQFEEAMPSEPAAEPAEEASAEEGNGRSGPH